MVKSVNNNPNVMVEKKNEGKDKKGGGAIMIKNIKSKIVGNNTGLASSIKSKEPLAENKKFLKTQNIVEIKNVESVSTPRNHSQNFSKSSFGSSMNLGRRTSVDMEKPRHKLNIKMFEVGQKLGKGRFGDVYMAREILTGFALAIKVINKK